MDLITVNNLGVQFETRAGTVDALRGVSFRVRAGATVAIVGESGSGKSVAAQAIMGILPRTATITSGEILLSDPDGGAVTDLTKLDPTGPDYRAIRGGRISIIFQEPMTSLSPLHTVGNQVHEALILQTKLSGKEAEARCIDMLRLVNFPDPERAYKTYPFELSGGLRQRAMIAMALVCHPALLIADEPTTALDVTIQAQILALIRDLQTELGMAVLMITHDMGVVANVAEEVIVVYHGEVLESGTVNDVFENPTHPYLRALLGAVPKLDSDPGVRLVAIREFKPVKGHLMTEKAVFPEDMAGKPLIEVRDLCKTFTIRSERRFLGREPATVLRAVDGVSFDIKRGECLGLVGESGCGKTTVSRMIMRAIGIDSGEVIFNGPNGRIDLTHLNDAEMVPIRRNIQYVFQDPFGSLNPRLTVFDILSEPLQIHGIGDRAYQREMVVELMQLVELDPRYLNRYPHSFSGGQRQRIGIARALALKPEMLICDEPVSALDVSVQAQVLNLLKDLQRELGLTYLFISHDLAVVKYVADRIAVMCHGQLVELAPRDMFFENPRHPYTQALLTAVPEADPNRPLDFETIRKGVMSDPENWPEPFDLRETEPLGLIDLGEGHFVRAHRAPLATDAAE